MDTITDPQHDKGIWPLLQMSNSQVANDLTGVSTPKAERTGGKKPGPGAFSRLSSPVEESSVSSEGFAAVND